jgi:periplasmic copper chaperone A
MKSTNAFRGLALSLLAAAGLLQAATATAQVVATEGWTRATAPGAKTGVGYLVLTNKGSEEASLMVLTSTVSDKVQIHRTSLDAKGVARMWPVGFLKIQPGESVRFDPNGLHLMFNDIKAPFTVGKKIPVRLIFEHESEINIELEVRPLVPEAAAHR